MNYLKANAVPLLIGAVVGYMVAKHGGVAGVTSRAKSAVSG